MNPTTRFDTRVADYVAARPSYPDGVFDALFDGLGDPASLTIVDLGAGTGISSRQLAARGSSVIAIEPNAPMRAGAAPARGVSYVDGTAEATGLDEASADLVTVFQAFHWFDQAASLREMLRILRPGGRAAVVYNERDERDPFTAAYGDIVRKYAQDATEQRRSDAKDAAFAAFKGWRTARHLAFPNPVRQDVERIVKRAFSSSYLPKSGSAGAALEAEIRALVAAHAVDGLVTMSLETLVIIGDTGTDGG
jgi:ubiquinone/menaquinone biosynthesis C-methylase UbiE